VSALAAAADLDSLPAASGSPDCLICFSGFGTRAVPFVRPRPIPAAASVQDGRFVPPAALMARHRRRCGGFDLDARKAFSRNWFTWGARKHEPFPLPMFGRLGSAWFGDPREPRLETANAQLNDGTTQHDAIAEGR
jgi:hypothetical protein|tara:strand:+ start:332 stop:739 length:408 start_codon:yes stop_codon:yes gene_type:complete